MAKAKGELFDQFESQPKRSRTTTSAVRLTREEKLALKVAALGRQTPIYQYLHDIVMPTVYRDCDATMFDLRCAISGKERASV
jgi:hypothetical protein